MKAGRKKYYGHTRHYKVSDEVHNWIMDHGGGKYVDETIKTIIAVSVGKLQANKTDINL